MTVLAIDTCANLCAAALFDPVDGTVLATMTEDLGRGHAERLTSLVGETLASAAIAFSDLSRIIVTVGPGSFTGIRVGVSAARGYGMALGVPVDGITSFALLAHGGAAAEGTALVTVAGGRGQVFAQMFAQREAVGDAMVIQVGDNASASQSVPTLLGNGAPLIDPGETCRHVFPDRATGDIDDAFRAFKAGSVAPEPLYLRAADAKPQTGFALPRASGPKVGA
ncbi:MAG: tRNA (adenosine(37)-N6)-threonylcarbamoyltransferase complex dimerization subunit type 1 TsaB [Pseudomonadota bacterium]